ncbi:MAG: glycosyltransferase [Nitrospiraceae bacterium]|nr:glycosyltransferase [Nitrospiraceae bacterium]
MAVVLDQPFWFDGVNYSTNAPFINFVLSFREKVDSLFLFAPLKHSRSERGRLGITVQDGKVRIVPIPFYRTTFEMYLKLPFMWMGTRNRLRREMAGFDVAWIMGGHVLADLSGRFLKKNGKKAFFYYRSNLVEEVRSHGCTSIKGKILVAASRLIQRFSLSTARDAVVFVVGDELKDVFQKSGRSVHKIYPSIITAQDIKKKNVAREPARVNFVAVGRLTPEKGLDDLVRAAELLVSSGFHRFVFRLIGDGKERERLQRMVAQAGLGGYLEFAGFVQPGKDLLAAYDNADAFVLPSRTEGIPKVLYEAMARGLPVVASNVGGVPEIVDEGVNGLLVPPGDPAALARAIRILCDEKLLREGFGKKGLETAGKFAMEKQRDAMYGLIVEHVIGEDNFQ